MGQYGSLVELRRHPREAASTGYLVPGAVVKMHASSVAVSIRYEPMQGTAARQSLGLVAPVVVPMRDEHSGIAAAAFVLLWAPEGSVQPIRYCDQLGLGRL